MDELYSSEKASHEQEIGAMSCGYTGFVLLRGMFDESLYEKETLKMDVDKVWRSQILSCWLIITPHIMVWR